MDNCDDYFNIQLKLSIPIQVGAATSRQEYKYYPFSQK